ncbi:Metallo-hydrolase/oxidoreductase [Obba rivulosa]|uniref:Metallo-hydrolase/oxidoreductase n=1 Tax=Obba rivulosa TaxID=1052685 RepID=A0A8E2DRH5_9APHY|nr:Metallo-hydrolase/oxidoreductase [Obba rivulosa]
MLTLAEFLFWLVAGIYFYILPFVDRTIADADARDLEAQPEPPARRSAFVARRLTPTTFLIVEHDDIFDEHPFIYARIFAEAKKILLVDTGCGGRTRDRTIEITRLREFIETVCIPDNGGRPLNEGGRMEYAVVLTHCHYDHILGVEQFAVDSPIYQSGHSPSFISPDNLPKNSLCEHLSIRTPTFEPSLVPHRSRLIFFSPRATTNVVLLHTPGHTPDEVALWDEDEKMLYVGDTLYEYEPIIFPNEGNIVQWLWSVNMLIDLVWRTPLPESAMINCGHRTAMRPALDVLRTTKAFMLDVLAGKEKIHRRETRRGIEYVEYVQPGQRYRLICPERLILEAREQLEI